MGTKAQENTVAVKRGDNVAVEFEGSFGIVAGMLGDHYYNESGKRIINAIITTEKDCTISGPVKKIKLVGSFEHGVMEINAW